MKRLILVSCFLIAFFSEAQENKRLDSLLKISRVQEPLDLINTLNEISWEYRNAKVDSAIFYGFKSLDVAKTFDSKNAIASSYNTIAIAFEAKSELDSASIYHNKSLEIKRKINDTIGIADTYNNLGIIADTKGNYANALEHYFKALKLYEQTSKNPNDVPKVLVNIGIVYKKQKEYEKVLSYYNRALKIYEENNYEFGEVITKGNIGSILLSMHKYKKSISYSEDAKKMYERLGYTRYVPYMQVNMAIAKDSLRMYKEAREDYLASISSFTIDNNLYELSNAQIALAKSYSRDKMYSKAKDLLIEALKISSKNDYKEMEVKALKQLAYVNASVKNYKQAFSFINDYAINKDSLFEEEKTKTVFELETKYDTEKKERKILEQRATLAEQELLIQKRNYQVYGSLGFALILGLIGYLFYNQQKLKNVQLKKENELKDALIKIETQNKLQEQRLRISRDLHDNIGAQLTFIISSLDNLKYGYEIPDKLNTKLKYISEFTSSTILELRDTIWAMNKSEVTIEDLQIRISNFIEKANLAATNTDFNFEVNNCESNFVFTSVQGMNIYRIIQEAINNAIKYSEASEISVLVTCANDQIKVVINDNGIGFDEHKVELGNGLNNMKKRTQELGAKITITSKQSKGTSVTLTF